MFDVFYIDKKPGLFPHERQVASIEQAQTLSRTRFFWIVNYLCDYSKWDWLYEPRPWEAHQRHAWASTWQGDSGTYLVPRSGYSDTNYHSETMPMKADLGCWENINSVEQFDFSWHPDYRDPPYNYEFGTQWQKTGGPRYPMSGATETKYVSQSGSTVKARASMAYIIDHLDDNVSLVGTQVNRSVANIRAVRFFGNYLDTLKRIARNASTDNHEFIWICSSVCDYETFDFTWHPEAWQNNMLHVFPSSGEKFGDTFFMHVPTFNSKINEFELLEWYDLNFVNVNILRRPIPVILHKEDCHVNPVQTQSWSGPLAVFTTHDYVDRPIVTVPLWREKTRTIVPLDPGGETVIVPRDAVPYIKKQLYDYPYIDKDSRVLRSAPLDVVFISNGEYGAEHHWNHLCDQMRGKPNRVTRSQNVNGRVAAYHAAAEASTTPWFFAVFAKLQVNSEFDWAWQPDRLQQPKHYIFHAYNPVNHLVYGHQAMIAYNKKLVLANVGPGLDFTLDQEHEVVPMVSGTAYYDNDPWTCWRTAFREAIKLRHSLPDVENEYRLDQWLSVGDGVNGQWSVWGAEDAVDYYNSVNGDFEEIKKSYEWAWLASYALIRRNLVPDQ